MKDQYVGDIGDYGKYGLLRFIAKNGIKIGVNWYYTNNDNTNDGNNRKYLSDEEERESIYDKKLYSCLKQTQDKNNRNIKYIEQSKIINNAIFYSTKIYKNTNRLEWHNDATNQLNMDHLNCLKLIFTDPDNGSTNNNQPISIKHVTLKELNDYYEKGNDVVYYCHKGRRSKEEWNIKKNELTNVCDAQIIVLTYRRGTQRSYIFGIHKKNFKKYDSIITDFLKTNWGTKRVLRRNIPFIREN